jgi:hypothetical protein
MRFETATGQLFPRSPFRVSELLPQSEAVHFHLDYRLGSHFPRDPLTATPSLTLISATGARAAISSGEEPKA